MQLRFRLLLLAALVVLVVAGSAAAREETKPQESSESSGLEAGGEKSKKQKEDIQLNTGKQKWQRFKPPSSKKAKKEALRKEKALAKSGKEKWKAAAEGVKGKKGKRSVQYVERDSGSRQKLTKEDKEKSLQQEAKRLKVTGKQTEKRSEDSSVCAKDELCSDESVVSERKKWKRKNSGKEGKREKSKAGDENSSDETESVSENGRTETTSDRNVLKQRTPEGSKQTTKTKGTKSPEASPGVQPDRLEESASKLKAAKVDRREDADGTLEEENTEGTRKNSSGNRKVKRSYIVEEEYDPECTSCSDGSLTDTDGTESSNWNPGSSLGGQSRIRRYIVEEEIIEENGNEEQGATDGDEKSGFMH